MKPDKAPSLGRILESAVILGWSDLMKDAKSGALHLEYAFTPDSSLDCLSFGRRRSGATGISRADTGCQLPRYMAKAFTSRMDFDLEA